MKKLLKSLICVGLILSIFACSSLSYFAKANSIKSQFDNNAIDIINAFSGKDFLFSVNATKQLYSISGEFSYTLYKLSPYGYAILNSNNMLLEACYENAQPPIATNDRSEYFYIGPTTFAKKINHDFVETTSSAILAEDALQEICELERKVNSFSQAENLENALQKSVTESTSSRSINNSYFNYLIDYAENRLGTCTVIAIAILLGYYDLYANSNYIADNYKQCSSPTASIGTTESFHQLLCNYVYGSSSPGGIFIHDTIPQINSYLTSVNAPGTFSCISSSNDQARQKIRELINTDRLAVSSTNTYYGADIDHTYVVYGYSTNNSTTLYHVFKGHSWLSAAANNLRLNESWFYDCGYIVDCLDSQNPTHNLRTYNTNYHSGNYHYYETLKKCTICPYSHTTVTSRYCNGNCIEIMNTTTTTES